MNAPFSVVLVPENIWRQVFLTLYHDSLENSAPDWFEEEAADSSPPERAVACISSVCQTWRTIACECSALWHWITFCGPEGARPFNSVERFVASFIRSRSQPIVVRIAITPNSSRMSLAPLIEIATPHLDRIEALYAAAFLPNSMDLRRMWEGNPMHSASRQLPLTGLPSSNLKTLSLNDVLFSTTDHVHILLRNCIQLEHLRVRGRLGPIEIDSGPKRLLHLPCLKTASFELDFLGVLLFISDLQTPDLEDLEVGRTGLDPVPYVPPFGFAASIHTLSLHGHFHDALVIGILPSVPKLRHLSLKLCEAGSLLIGDVLCRTQAKGHAVPELQLLAVESGSFTDEDAISLLDARDASKERAIPTLMLQISDCSNTSQRLGQELYRRRRGYWHI